MLRQVNNTQRNESLKFNNSQRTARKDICLELVPKKRKNRAREASMKIFTLTAIVVVVLCFINNKTVEYRENNSPDLENQTFICYKRTEKLMFPWLFNTSLSLLGIILGTFVERLSLIAEERHHVSERYGGSWFKMFKACFGEIPWRPVIIFKALAGVIVFAFIVFTDISIEVSTCFVYIVGGIGVGPFIRSMLNLNTQSQVQLATIIEQNHRNIANGLAWYYYFTYLNKALRIFTELTSGNRRISRKLSENKLLLLLSHDCHTENNLENIDRNFKKIDELESDHFLNSFTFPVYRLKVNENQYRYYAVQFVKEPLQTLKNMCHYEFVEGITMKQREDEVKLICRTLFEILRMRLKKRYREKCVLIPYKEESLKRLDNGGLVRLVLHALEHTCTHSTGTAVDQEQGFWKFSPRDARICGAYEHHEIVKNGKVYQRITPNSPIL